MAYKAFIFHSPKTKEKVFGSTLGTSTLYGDTGYVYNGQIVIYIGTANYSVGANVQQAVIKWYDLDDNTWKAACAGTSGIWDTPTYKNYLSTDGLGHITEGYCVDITSMNDVVYGSNWRDPHAGGSVYGSRFSTTLHPSEITVPVESKAIAFSRDQGYLMNNSIPNSGDIYIRMYGYYKSGEVWQETTGQYYWENICVHPSEYNLNTF